MKAIFTTNPSEFLNLAEDFLLKEESLNNLSLGLAERLKTNGMANPGSGEPFFIILENHDEVVGTALRSSPERPLALSRIGEENLTELIKVLEEKEIVLEGCVGPTETVEAFCKLWKTPSKPAMRQGVYECVKIIPPREIKGSLIKASLSNSEEVDTAVLFGAGFIEECFPLHREPIVEARKMVEFYIEQSVLFLWKNEDGDLVSMAVRNRESKNASTIGWVFTPKEQRGKGYGSMVTFGVTQEIFKSGKKLANLFTDMNNPTSNSIYQKIGFRKIADSTHVDFLK